MLHANDVVFYLIEKRDDAILGITRGTQSQRVLRGPFETEEEAMALKPRPYSSTYFIVVESDERPREYEREYEFADAEHEFDDI